MHYHRHLTPWQQAMPKLLLRALSILLAASATLAVQAQEHTQQPSSQTPQVHYQVYQLRHGSAAEIRRIVEQILGPNAGDARIVVDERANRLLVEGPDFVHALVKQAISELDAPHQSQEQPNPVLHSYRCPPGALSEIVALLRRQFEPAGVRFATDPNTGLIAVLATEEQHEQISRIVQQTISRLTVGKTRPEESATAPQSQQQPFAPAPQQQSAGVQPPIGVMITGQAVAPGTAQQTMPPVEQPNRFPAPWKARQPIPSGQERPFTQSTAQPQPSALPAFDQQRGAAYGPASAQQAVEASPRVELFVQFFNVSFDRARELLKKFLGDKIQLLAAQNQREQYLLTAGENLQAFIQLDRHKGGAWVTGPPRLAEQVTQLLRAIDLAHGNAEETVRLVTVRRASRLQVDKIIRAYRSQRQESKQQGNGSSNDQPNNKQVRKRTISGVRLVQHIAPLVGESAAAFAFQPQISEVPDIQPEAPQMPEQPLPEEEQPGPIPPIPGEREVEIETLPDLGVIILRGRQRDVEELSQIIAELERLSAETQPAVDIYMLRHVDCRAMVTVVQQVAPDLVGGRQGRVSLLPLVKPNALLIIGWGDAVEVIKELVAKLDQPVDPRTQLRVFHLRHAAVTTVQNTIRSAFMDREGLSPRVQVVADTRTNALIVRASPRDMAEVELLISQLDGESQAVNRTRIFKLRNSLATDLAATLQQAIAAAGSAGGKSAVVELVDVDKDAQQVIRSGILSDVVVTPDPRTNTLIVSGPAESMDLVAKLIEKLDTPTAVAQIKVFRIINGDATAMAQILQSIFPVRPAYGPQLAGAEGETTLVPVRFTVDVRTNSIIATGSRGDLAIVEALLLRLDEEEVKQRINTVYRLHNAPAAEVARSLNDFLRSERALRLAAPGVISPFEQIEREVVIVPEPVSNSLIISATPRFFDEIIKLVEKLDEQPPQVLIQVLIAEVELGNVDEFGVELGLQDSVLFDRSLLSDLQKTTTTYFDPISGQRTSQTETIVSATNEPGFDFNNKPLGNSGSEKALATSKYIGTQGLTHFALGRVNSSLNYGGLVLSASSENVSILIRALNQTRRLNVLARPQIMTLDNQPAFIQVGKRVPRIVGTRFDGRAQTNVVELEPVGLILAVTPRVSPDGTVVMDIDAEKSALGPEEEGVPISVSDGTVIRSPSVTVTTAQTTIAVGHGETVILGGLITQEKQRINRRIPLLSDIPVIGQAFQYDYNETNRTELLIILTPYVVRGPEDMERIKQLEAARMSWCLADVNEIHGPIGVYGEKALNDTSDAVITIYPDLNPRGEPTLAPPQPTQQEQPPELVPTPAPLEQQPAGPQIEAPTQPPAEQTPPPHPSPQPTTGPTFPDATQPQQMQGNPPEQPMPHDGQGAAGPVVQPPYTAQVPQAGYQMRFQSSE